MRLIIQSSLFILCVLSAVWAYQVNYDARSIEREIKDLNSQVNSVSIRIDLLEAEWAFLNRPKRLAKLVDKNFSTLRLVPITKEHFKVPGELYSNTEKQKDGE